MIFRKVIEFTGVQLKTPNERERGFLIDEISRKICKEIGWNV